MIAMSSGGWWFGLMKLRLSRAGARERDEAIFRQALAAMRCSNAPASARRLKHADLAAMAHVEGWKAEGWR